MDVQTQYIEKVAQEKVAMSPLLLDVMQRVRERGLHKVATQIAPIPELTLEKVAQSLGTQMLYQHHKYARIHDGLNSLNNLKKEAGFWSTVGSGLRRGWDALGEAGAHVGGNLAVGASGINRKFKNDIGLIHKGIESGVMKPTQARAAKMELAKDYKGRRAGIQQTGADIGAPVMQHAALMGGTALVGSQL